ncbi:MAG: HlyD family efflux transporter periplasmic adaptor subunit [Gammaproteobacteria bacterium]|nr:HlyD family efflux transporter periplasmic adaptor subunit [Gammaproteobacteria bacterium]
MPSNDKIQSQIEGLATLLVLDDEIRKLSNLREFAFFSTNETHRLISYHTAYLWQKKEFIGTNLIMQSGTAEIDVHAPTNQWLKYVINKICDDDAVNSKKIHLISQSETELSDITDNWPETLPHYFLWCPLLNKTNEITGGLIFFKETPFSDSEIKMLGWLISSYQYTWNTLTKSAIKPSWQKLKDKPYVIGAGIVTLTVLFFPVHLSVLGTGTVIPKSPVLINSPMQGIIKAIYVDPGNPVKIGQLLFSIDKTELQASSEVSEKDLLLTQEKLRAVIQEGFIHKESDAEIPILQAQINIDKAHLNYTNALLSQADIKSPVNGIVIFDNKENWIGQPARTGERILIIADPYEVEVKITIPVSDIIKLEKGANGDLFLYGELNPIPIKITTLGYNAKQMPNRILAYQLNASFVNADDRPQIGAQGTVKVYGNYVPFIYYLLRRPLQSVRQVIGI